MEEQLNLLPSDAIIAKEEYDRARKANNGTINRQAARMYDAVHRELWNKFPKPSAEAIAKPVVEPGYTVVREHKRVIAPTRPRQADQSLALSVGA